MMYYLTGSTRTSYWCETQFVKAIRSYQSIMLSLGMLVGNAVFQCLDHVLSRMLKSGLLFAGECGAFFSSQSPWYLYFEDVLDVTKYTVKSYQVAFVTRTRAKLYLVTSSCTCLSQMLPT